MSAELHFAPTAAPAARPAARWFKRATAGIAIAGCALLVACAGALYAGARVNTTKSIPIGLYWTSTGPVEKGAYVMFCPPQLGVFTAAMARGYIGAGFCDGGYGYMMKRVLAAKDDLVNVTDEGVRVNGELLPLSKPIKADKSGRPLPRYQANTYTLGNAEVLLMSDVSGTSFDGRYFGPINRAQIQTVIVPVVTW